MSKFFTFLMLNFIFWNFSYAQTLKITDSLGIPIVGARIIVKNGSGKLVSILTSNNDGIVTSIEQTGTTSLIISSDGYKTLELTRDGLLATDTILAQLEANINQLRAIKIEGKKSIEKKGDTTIIRLPNFKNQNDRKFIEVLKRIPGIEVSRNGEVKYKGKTITDLLINGQKLFDRDYNSALKILNPEKMVEIKIIDKYQDNNGFTKKSNKDVALDIKYSEKAITSSTIDLGKGLKQQAEGNVSNLSTAPSIANFALLNFDNIGRSRLVHQSLREGTADLNLTDKRYFLPFIDNLSTSLFEYDSDFNRTYAADDNVRVGLGKKNNLLIKTKNFWEEIDRRSEYSLVFGLFDSLNNRDVVNTKRVISRNNEVESQFTHTGDSHFFMMEANISRQNYSLDDNSLVNSTNINFDRTQEEAVLFLNTKYQYKWDQDNVTEFEFIGIIGDGYIDSRLNELVGINQKTNFTDDHIILKLNQPLQRIGNWRWDTSISTSLDNYKTEQYIGENLDSPLISRESLTLIRLASKMDYKKNRWEMDADLGIVLFQSKNKINSSVNQYRPEVTLSGSYSTRKWINTLTTSITNNWIKNNFNTINPIRIGSTESILYDFLNEPVQNVNTNYSISNLGILQNYSFGFSLDSSNKSLVNSTDFSPDISILKYQLVPRRSNQYSINANTTQYLRFLKGNLMINSSYGLGEGFISTNQTDIERYNYQNIFGQIAIKKRVNREIYASIYYKANHSKFEQLETTRTNFTYSAGAYFDLNIDNYSVKINGDLENFGRTESFFILDATVDYTPNNSKWQYYIKALNLLDINTIQNRSVDQFSITTQSINVPGTRLLFACNFNF